MRGLVAAVALVVALGSACASRETRHGAAELRDALGTPSWASSVDVTSGRDGRLADQVRVTVEVRRSARAGDLAAFLLDLPDRAADAGLEGVRPELTFVASSGATLSVDWRGDVDVPAVSRGVASWWLVATAFIGLDRHATATLGSDGGTSYVFALGDAARWESPFLVSTFLGPLIEPDTAVEVTGTVDSVAIDFATASAPSFDDTGLWDDLRNALDRLPATLTPIVLTLRRLDRTVVDLGFLTPAGTTAEAFTVDAWGARVWPVVRPQLAALHGQPGPWTYSATQAPADATYDTDLFLSLLSDQDPVDNGDEATRWSLAAQQYVQEL